ncbi:MAG: rhodanese-like domain-containing protein [Flavobacteriales bacterium]|jgi:rhodanese-related sulfurtransferase|nr:rhodanese-like domain-containing protein [Flavobacteriales bacterium]
MNIENLTKDPFWSAYQADENAVLIDVRTAPEIAEKNIEGHLAIDFFASDFQTKINELDKSKNYYMYCRSGNRSMQACYMMNQMGFTGKLINLAGGMLAW